MLIVLFTCNDQFQVERVLAGSVAGDAGVDACVAAGHRFDDQRVHAVFSHQHLMGRIRADGLSVQLPDEVRSGQAAHLQEGKKTQKTLHLSECMNAYVICACFCWKNLIVIRMFMFIGSMKTV